MAMKCEMTISDVAALAVIKLCEEYLKQGGSIPGVENEHVEQALEALENADRIIIEAAP